MVPATPTSQGDLIAPTTPHFLCLGLSVTHTHPVVLPNSLVSTENFRKQHLLEETRPDASLDTTAEQLFKHPREALKHKPASKPRSETISEGNSAACLVPPSSEAAFPPVSGSG